MAMHLWELAWRAQAYSLSQALPIARLDRRANKMVRKFPLILFVLATTLMAAGSTAAGTYYIAANGSDSNNGTSKTTPWQHAPGMPKCTGTCAGHTPVAGDQYIFRGGDTWHFGNSAATPYVGAGGWNWNWSGNSTNPIYIGVDQTWYGGSAWARPIMSGDNPLSTSFVSSCQYDESTTNFVYLNNVNYVTFDNFEFPAKCWSSATTDAGSIYMPGNTNVTISNSYFHGWTTTLGSQDNHYSILGGGAGTNVQIVGDIFDGSDSSQGAANSSACANTFVPSSPCQSGEAVYLTAWDVHGCIFRYLSNMMVTNNTHTVHDNLFEYLYNSYDGRVGDTPHSNVMNQVTNLSGSNTYFYNNVVRHTYVTEDIYFAVGSTGYFFNNVFYDNMTVPGFGTVPTGCIRFNAVSSSGTQTAYIYNNTIDSPCQFNFDKVNSPLQPWNGTAYFKNDHFIGSGGNFASVYVCNTTGQCTVTDTGNEVYQTESTANAQGYVPQNDYAPTQASNATVGAGSNQSSSCTTFSNDSELCGGTSDAANEQSGGGGEIAYFPAISMIPRPASGSWDAGAYEFSAAGGPPSPPSGLAAQVQ
jgi:hypothetical protein